MSTIQQAFEDVGYRPIKRQTARQMMAFNRDHIIMAQLETVVDGVVEPLIKPRKVQVQRAGDFYKARYAGEATCCFGTTPQDATRKIKFFASES